MGITRAQVALLALFLITLAALIQSMFVMGMGWGILLLLILNGLIEGMRKP